METFEERFKNIESEKLIKIVFIHRDDYQPIAISAAENELSSRGITENSDIVKSIIHSTAMQEEEKDTAQLGKNEKIIFFLCGIFFVSFIIAGLYVGIQKEKRGIKKTKDSWKWLWSGLLTILLINLIVLGIVFLL